MAASTYDIVIEQGATFKIRLRPSSLNVDFTDSVTRGAIRRKYSDPATLATFQTLNGDDGEFYVDVWLPASATTAIPVNTAVNHNKRESYYCYDIETELTDGTVYRLLQGTVDVSPEVTK